MIRTQISVDENVYARAKAMAKHKGISLAELCRRALEEVISREPSAKTWRAQVGILDGASDDSVSVDSVVYGRERP